MKYIAGILGISIVIGVALLFIMDTAKRADSANVHSFSGSLFELSNRSGNWECTFANTSDRVRTSGVVYVSEGKTRGDFESKAEGITVESHIIVRDGFIYTWSPIAQSGFKARHAVNNEANNDSDFQYAYEYTCTPWAVDSSLFEIPPIAFVDV